MQVQRESITGFCGQMLQVKVQIGVISAVTEGLPSPQRITEVQDEDVEAMNRLLLLVSWDFYLIIGRVILQHLTVTLIANE